jgi:hypothetical protein
MIPAPCHQLGGIKISSQLANNFDYCSAERNLLVRRGQSRGAVIDG